MKEPTMFGKLLNRVRAERMTSVMSAKQKLWERRKLENPTKRDKFKMEESSVVHRDGREIIEIRLYELVDAAVVIINSDVTSEIKGGISELREFNREQ